MPCFSPLKGFRAFSVNASGKRSIVFNPAEGYSDRPVELPCGKCVGCRLEYSRNWAVRACHEASLYDSNCFITLTYNRENLPPGGSLVKDHFRAFMKRFRERVRYESGRTGIRAMYCGEYGDKFGRPHFHACLFNYDFEDKKFWKKSRPGRFSRAPEMDLYRSPFLEEMWPEGYSSVGSMTFESAAYVARYIMKKQKGPDAAHVYAKAGKAPEFLEVPRGPGLGAGWIEKYYGDVFPSDEVILGGKRFKPPVYYMDWFEKKFPAEAAEVMRNRRIQGYVFRESEESQWHRVRVREKVLASKVKLLRRSLDED